MSIQKFGKYQLIKKLATGGMAEVWLAAAETGIPGLQKNVVIKRILPHLAEDAEFVEMFQNEARISLRFNHPNICQMSEVGEENGSHFLAMEFIDGRDLGRLMRKAWSSGQWLARQLSIRIVANCCDALYYAHGRSDDAGNPLQVVHRDISPQNILIGFDGSVKVVDFGIAKAADQASLTKSGAIKGKFAYMSPEQASGKVVDHRTDIFAVGLVLYELLTGVRPLKKESEIATLQAALECSIEAPSAVADVPPELDGVVMKALAKTVEDRYRDAREFQLALEELLAAKRWVASSAHLAELMETLFAQDRAEERRLGRPNPPEADISASGPPAAPPAFQEERTDKGAPPQHGAWDPPGTAVARSGSGRSKSRASGLRAARPEMDARPEVEEWEAPPATGIPGKRRSSGETRAGELRLSNPNQTALARVSRPELPRPGAAAPPRRSSLPSIPAADYDDEPGETRARPPTRAAPRPSAMAEPTGSGIAPRRPSSADLARAEPRELLTDPGEEPDFEDTEFPEPSAAPQPRRRSQSRPIRRISRPEVRKVPREQVEDEPEVSFPVRRSGSRRPPPALPPPLDPDAIEAQRRRLRQRLKWMVYATSAAALGLMALLFHQSVWDYLRYSQADHDRSKLGVFVSVETNVPVEVWVRHAAAEKAPRAEERLGHGQRLDNLRGAHLKDTIVLRNAVQGITHEREIAYGQPGERILIRKEFRTGSVRLRLQPASLRGVQVLRGEQVVAENTGTGLQFELVEGHHDLELHSPELTRPRPFSVTVKPDAVVTVREDLRALIER